MKIFMKWVGRTGLLLLAVVIAAVWSGCTATEKLVEELGEKDVTGSGFVSIQKLGVDPDTKIPAMKSTIISGDFQTIRAGTTYLNYKDEESSSWYSSSITNRRRTLTISLDDNANLSDVLNACSAAFDKVPQSNVTTSTVPEGADVIEINGKKAIVMPGTIDAAVITKNGNILVINQTPGFAIPAHTPTGEDIVYVNGLKIVVPPDKINMTIRTENGNVLVINPVSEIIAAETIPTGSDGTVPKQVE